MENMKESSLSRIYNKMMTNDTGAITAFRSNFTNSENKDRNKLLLAKLFRLGYGVTSIKGSYIEDFGTVNAQEVGEDTFFVEDLKAKGNLEQDLVNLGKEFDQDSILFIPKGGDGSVLIGTNNADFPGLNQKISMGKFGGGQSGEFFSRVNGRPFVFKESLHEHQAPSGMMGRWAMQKRIEVLTKSTLIEGKIVEAGAELHIIE